MIISEYITSVHVATSNIFVIVVV